MTPVAVIGVPMHDGAPFVAESIESLLSQTAADLRLVLLDDASRDGTVAAVQPYLADPRVTLESSERRLGLVGAWRRVFERALELAPDALYFAWGSDHDVWHRTWLESLAGELDDHPEAVLAYPLDLALSEHGADLGKPSARFDTRGIPSPHDRLAAVTARIRAGTAVYGLYRRNALVRAGPFPAVLLPDRLLLARLALEGEFRQVERLLWLRRYRTGVGASSGRQRRSFFPDGPPLSSYSPWWLAHTVALARTAPAETHPGRVALLYLRVARRRRGENRRADRSRRRARTKRRLRRRLGSLRRALPRR